MGEGLRGGVWAEGRWAQGQGGCGEVNEGLGLWGDGRRGLRGCGEVNKRLRGQSWVCGEVSVGAEGSLPLSQLSKM